jgi:hypothetical protein
MKKTLKRIALVVSLTALSIIPFAADALARPFPHKY